MGKVKDMVPAGKSKSKALTQSGGGNAERDRLQQAMQLLANKVATKGFEATIDTTETRVLEESGNVVEKDLMVGVEHLIVSTRFTISKQFGTPFVSVTAMLRTGEFVIYNDGSTGICKQLDGIEIDPEHPLHVPGGLRRSDYDVDGPNGTKIKASTYYLSGRRSVASIKGLQRNADANGRALRA